MVLGAAGAGSTATAPAPATASATTPDDGGDGGKSPGAEVAAGQRRPVAPRDGVRSTGRDGRAAAGRCLLRRSARWLPMDSPCQFLGMDGDPTR